MSEQPSDNTSGWDILNNDCALYRAVLSPSHLNRQIGRFKKQAFMRRGPNNEGIPRDIKGLSVKLAEHCTTEDIRGCLDVTGIGKLHVKHARNIETDDGPSLDVVRDKIDHANITGLPAYGEDVFKAENYASQLAECCDPVYIKPK